MRGFAKVPHDLTCDQRLSGCARGLYAMFWSLAWMRGRREDDDVVLLPTSAELAAMFQCSIPSLRAYVRELVDTGWIDAIRGGGRPTRYRIFDSAKVLESSNSGGKNLSLPRAGASKGLEAKKEQEAQSASRSSLARQRKRDVVFDALAEATSSDPHLEGKLIGMEVAKLRSHPDYIALRDKHGKEFADEALAREIPLRAEAYRRYFKPSIALTAPALVKHWKRVHEQRASDEDLFSDWDPLKTREEG